jgi:hypothetical protein
MVALTSIQKREFTGDIRVIVRPRLFGFGKKSVVQALVRTSFGPSHAPMLPDVWISSQENWVDLKPAPDEFCCLYGKIESLCKQKEEAFVNHPADNYKKPVNKYDERLAVYTTLISQSASKEEHEEAVVKADKILGHPNSIVLLSPMSDYNHIQYLVTALRIHIALNW